MRRRGRSAWSYRSGCYAGAHPRLAASVRTSDEDSRDLGMAGRTEVADNNADRTGNSNDQEAVHKSQVSILKKGSIPESRREEEIHPVACPR